MGRVPPRNCSLRFLQVLHQNPKAFRGHGVRENDMVFFLGFPGYTMRYAPTPRLRHADDVAVPPTVRDFSKKLDLIAKHEGYFAKAALKLGSIKKGLANELKRSKGKLVMMRKLKLLEERLAEEAALADAFPDTVGTSLADATSVADILSRLDEIYASFRADHLRTSALEACRGIYGGSSLLAAGHSVHEYLTHERNKDDAERETTYRKRNLPFLAKRLSKRLRDIHLPHEAELVADGSKIFNSLKKSPPTSDDALSRCLEAIGSTLLKDPDTARNAVLSEDAPSKLLSMTNPDVDLLADCFSENGSPSEEAWLDDPFVKVAAALWDVYKRDKDSSKTLMSERDSLLAKLLEYQQRQQSDEDGCYPDCNGSLRISAGFVKGYEASDAVLHRPHTTLGGLLDKATEAKLMPGNGEEGKSEFQCPERLYKMLEENTTGEGTQKVPVCLLYSTDTVRIQSPERHQNRTDLKPA